MIEQVWDGILDFSSQFVIPDWGGLIALLPLFVLLLVVGFFARVAVQYATIGPRRRRPARLVPQPPPGVHMPPPTYSPILAGAGTFLLFLGLVFPGPLLLLGVAGLVLALLFWGAEGIREYDHLEDVRPRLPERAETGPPPGVHMPGPSFRPVLVALAVTVLLAGLIFGGWVLAAGVVVTIVSLLGWLNDARKEYRQVVAADRTGHLENEPAPAWPRLVLGLTVVLLVGAIVLDLGWLPPRSAGGGDGGPAGSPGASGAPSGSPSGGPAADVTIVAEQVKFTTGPVSVPAGKPFKIAFDNRDEGIPHDVDIHDAGGATVFDSKDFPGPEVRILDVPALDAGTYRYVCSIHASMTDELTAQ